MDSSKQYGGCKESLGLQTSNSRGGLSSTPSRNAHPSSLPEIFARTQDIEHLDGAYGLIPDPDMSINERKEVALTMAESLTLPQMLTSAQHEAAGTFEPRPNSIVWHATESGGNPAWLEVTAEKLDEIGCLEPLLRIRKKMLHKDYQPTLAATCAKAYNWFDYGEKKGTTYEYGATIQPTCGPSSIQLGTLARNADTTDAQDIFCTLLDACSRAADAFIPELDGRGREKYRLAKASLLPGSSRNKYFTTAQANFSDLYKGLKSLKKFGLIHTDRNDHQLFLTALVVFSETPSSYCNGRFNVAPLKISAPIRPCSIIFFSGREFHCSSGQGESSVPKGSPLELPEVTPGLIPDLLPREDYPYRRLTIPVYPTVRLMEPEFRWLNGELYTDKGVVIFENIHEHHKWMMNHYIVHEPEILGRLAYKAANSLLAYEIPKTTIEASGPMQMFQAAATCKCKDQEVPFTLKERTRNADHYVKLFAYIDPASGNIRKPPLQLAHDVLAALDDPNPEFEQLKKEMESVSCGTAFSKKKDGGTVKWIRQDEDRTDWEPSLDAVPSNPGFHAGDSSVRLEQLATAGAVAAAAMKIEAVANSFLEETLPFLLRDPSEPDEKLVKARKKRENTAARRIRQKARGRYRASPKERGKGRRKVMRKE